jgi:zinc transporter ZupT
MDQVGIEVFSATPGIFIGISLGITNSSDTAVALMVALFFHQANEGLALGVLFVKSRRSPLQYFLAAAAFVLVSPMKMPMMKSQ